MRGVRCNCEKGANRQRVAACTAKSTVDLAVSTDKQWHNSIHYTEDWVIRVRMPEMAHQVCIASTGAFDSTPAFSSCVHVLVCVSVCMNVSMNVHTPGGLPPLAGVGVPNREGV